MQKAYPLIDRTVPVRSEMIGNGTNATQSRITASSIFVAISIVIGLSHWPMAPAIAQSLPPALSPPTIKPTSGPWDAGAGFAFDLGKKKTLKTRQSVSGIACNLNAQQQRVCLLAFDEGVEARYATVSDQRLVADPEVVVLRTAGAGSELDAEGAATDGRYFYVTGSHSAKRSDCASNPESRHVIRFRLDPATGRALRSPANNPQGALVDYADTGRLWDIMQAQPTLAAHVGERKCLGSEPPSKAPSLAGQQGVNIEGLAVRGGTLYFGFRGPVVSDKSDAGSVAKVLAVNADALFAGGEPQAAVTSIALGAHRGIRDMVAVKTGLLLLAGPDDSAANKDVGWTVAWWDGKASGQIVTPKVLAILDLSGVKLRGCDEELKPEAITVLEETPEAYKLLVLSDGMCDGGALAFTVAR